MLRKIVDYSKLTDEVLDLLVQEFPDGYGDDDIIQFKNAKGETIKAVEVKTDEIIYLVKISVKLAQRMEDHSDESDIDLGGADLSFDGDPLYEEED
jgi:hypothetical protein